MSLVTLGDATVLGGSTLRLPRWGVWTATVEIDAAAPPEGRQDLVFDGATPVTFRGTVREATAWEGRTRVFLVGGADGLASDLPARSYVATPARLPVGDLVREVGETLAGTVNLDAYSLPAWVRAAGPAHLAMTMLATELGMAWRVLPDGTVWVGAETWPTGPSDLFVEQGPDELGFAIAAPETPTVLPGMAIDGQHVERVTYHLGDNGLRAEIVYGRDERSDFAQAVRAALPELLYLREYDATVVKQAADGTLELRCDDARIGGLTKVPIRLGLPGVRVEVSNGARVRVGFSNAEAKRPYAGLWDTDAGMVKITFDGGTKSIARVDDTVNGGTIVAGVAGPFPVTFTYLHPDPLHVPPVATGPSVSLVGLIDSGAAKLKG